jgi:hypothetical protein
MAVRDMTPDIGAAQIEDATPSIRLLLQQALGGQPKVERIVEETALLAKDAGDGPSLSD